MRCLALAQGWQARSGRATFVTACESDGLRQCLSDGGLSCYRITLQLLRCPRELWSVTCKLANLRLGRVMLERSYPDTADWNITSQRLDHGEDILVKGRDVATGDGVG